MNEEDKLIDELILSGALEVSGIDSKSGEALYSITPKMKDIMPDLYLDYLNTTNQIIMKLWEKKFVNMDLTTDDPIVILNPKAYDLYEISTLEEDEAWCLEEIKRLTFTNPDII